MTARQRTATWVGVLVAVARVLVVVSIAYLLVSIIVRVGRNEWVRSAGPVDTDAPTHALAAAGDDLVGRLRVAEATVEELRFSLERSVRSEEVLRATLAAYADEEGR